MHTVSIYFVIYEDIISGPPTPMIKLASIAPIVLNVDKDVRSTGSAVITDAIEPYGIFTVLYKVPHKI